MGREDQMKRLFYYLRYDWPLHLIMLSTGWLPDNVIFFRFRGMLARPFFGSCGVDLRLGRNITFHSASSVHIGSHVYIALGCHFIGVGEIRIGNEAIFGPYTVVSAANHTKFQGSYRYGPITNSAITIGSGTWVGAHTTVLAGAIIGKGCIIGSNAAVTKGIIPDDSFAAGVPAVVKKIKQSDSAVELPL